MNDGVITHLLDSVNHATMHPDLRKSEQMPKPHQRPELDDILSTIKKMVEDQRAKERFVLTPAHMVNQDTLNSAEPKGNDRADAKQAVKKEPAFLPPQPQKEHIKPPSDQPDYDKAELTGIAPAAPTSEQQIDLSQKIAALEELISRSEKIAPKSRATPSVIDHTTSVASEPDTVEKIKNANSAMPKEADRLPSTSNASALEEAPAARMVENVPCDAAAEELPSAAIHNFPRLSEKIASEQKEDEKSVQTVDLSSKEDAPVSDAVAAPVIEEDTPLTDDEMALFKSIIAEVVRQELQGQLGERITRNVRKLVRREIQQALMTRSEN